VQIDGFARLNELYGRTVGDDVLQAAAGRFQRAFRDADVAARLGASEFVFALYGSGRDDAAERIQTVADELHGIELTATNGVPVRFSMSAGVAELPRDGLEPRAVRRAATEALRYARAAGGDRVVTTAATTGEEPGQDRADVMVVEGDRELTALLVEAFSSRGWRTRQASDGQEALDLLGGAYPPVQASVLVIDAELPGPDGLTVLRRLSEAGHLKQTHPIVVTGRSTEAETLAAFEAGAADHVTKPFSLPVLMERVRAALGAAA
jgi:diguanylate cyclase (GGDEF)-like protein